MDVTSLTSPGLAAKKVVIQIICSSSDWKSSRCGYFRSLFGRIVFPGFSSYDCCF